RRTAYETRRWLCTSRGTILRNATHVELEAIANRQCEIYQIDLDIFSNRGIKQSPFNSAGTLAAVTETAQPTSSTSVPRRRTKYFLSETGLWNALSKPSASPLFEAPIITLRSFRRFSRSRQLNCAQITGIARIDCSKGNLVSSLLVTTSSRNISSA
ncbi:hypothetical protein SCHPADRAFT_1003494, partial [Schizopora paradoxa]